MPILVFTPWTRIWARNRYRHVHPVNIPTPRGQRRYSIRFVILLSYVCTLLFFQRKVTRSNLSYPHPHPRIFSFGHRRLPIFENISLQEAWQNGYPGSIIRPAKIGNWRKQKHPPWKTYAVVPSGQRNLLAFHP